MIKQIYFSGLVLVFSLPAFSQNETFPKIDPQNVTIVRDSFGIPHIFGKTDAEVAYGLAWANAEDAFDEGQDLVYAGKEYRGRADGIEGAEADFFIHAIGARRLVEEHYDKDLSPEFKKYIDGFAQGINAYAAAHPKEVKVKKAFPVTAKELVTSYVVMMSLLNGAPDGIGDAVGGKYDTVTNVFPEHQRKPAGSNAFALNSSRTTTGETYLCINPHMMMDGALSFYEAQLHSDEGLDIEGPMFQGTSSLAMGVNQNLGWGMTWNFFDRLDVYKLKMVPGQKLAYEFDGQTYQLEKRPVWLKVGLGKHHKFVLPVKKMTYWSKYGCTVKSDKSNSFYSLRFPGNTTIKPAEQLYWMNKAHSYAEFRKALEIHAISLFNIIYADKENNIFYMEHGMLPARKDTSFNWKGLLPGNTSKDLWTDLVPIDSMPHTINPGCGYVFNTNNSPFHATGKNCEPAYTYLPQKMVDGLPGDNNRANRIEEQLAAKDKFSFDDMRKLKFDVSFSHKGGFGESMEPIFHLDENKYPDLKEAIGIIKSWNRVAEVNESAPTLLALVIKQIFDKNGCDDNCFVTGFKVDEAEWVSSLRGACDTLKRHFGTVKVEWGTVQRNIRGNKNLPLRGFPDVLSPSYPKQVPGTFIFKPEFGDTYTMFASFGKNGLTHLNALQPLGNSLKPESKHYNDQMELFSRQEMRPLSLSKEEVMKKAESVYHPQ
jgi:acyl-homoserine-lactone acylase